VRSNLGRKNKDFSVFVKFLAFVALCVLTYYVYQGFFGKNAKIIGILRHSRNLVLAGQYDAATDDLNKALQLDRVNPLIYDAFGYMYNAKEDSAKAKECYSQALEKGVKYRREFAHDENGRDYFKKGKYSQALIEFEHHNRIVPGDKKGILWQGICLHSLERIQDAIEIYKRGLSVSPGNKELTKYLELAQRQKDSDAIDLIVDRNGVPVLRRSVAKGKLIFSAESNLDKIIGYSSEKLKLGLLDKMGNNFPGNTITLCIDSRLQRIASSALNTSGAVVILDPKTGAILAAVSNPKFNPDKIEKEYSRYRAMKNNVFLNRAFEGLYEPGSICKIITTSAMIESGLSEKDIFPLICNGSKVIEGKVFFCWEKHGNVKSVEEAIDQSCNIAFQKIGSVLGYSKIYEYANKYGFNTPIDMQLPVATSSVPIESESKYDLANKSTGLGKDFRITPLIAACMASTVANGGTLMKPYIIKEVKNIVGDSVYKEEPMVMKNVLKKETAAQLNLYMVDAVERGLGQKARVPGIKVAGKTGTARTSGKGLDGWFICFAPADNPKIAMAILCDASGKGMEVAAPVAKKIIAEALSQ